MVKRVKIGYNWHINKSHFDWIDREFTMNDLEPPSDQQKELLIECGLKLMSAGVLTLIEFFGAIIAVKKTRLRNG